MDLQQQDHNRHKLIILLLMLKAFTANNNVQMQRITNIYHLLALTTINTTIPFILSSPSTRIQYQPRPKTGGFWTDFFPFLVDEEGYNSFRQHFRITHSTFCIIVWWLVRNFKMSIIT